MKCGRVICILLFTLAFGSPASHAGQGSGWTAVAPMSVARAGHSMVELPAGPNALGLSGGPGKVMVIGGFDSEPLFVPQVPGTPFASCEIYDPVSNAWTPTAPHPVSAGWRWAAVVSNGMVLVVGGAKNLATTVASSHLYDPNTNRWIATAPLPIGLVNPHAFMRAIVLPNGQVLIAGGIDQNGANAAKRNKLPALSQYAYLFTLNSRNPEQSFWDYTRNISDGSIWKMPEGRTTSALVLMSNGTVLNVGGLGPSPTNKSFAATNTASIFDPTSGAWTPVAPMPAVYGLGEDELSASYPTAPGSRWSPYSQNLDNGQVLVAGGKGGVGPSVVRSSAVIYDPTTDSWRITTPMQFRRPIGSWSAKLPDGAGILFAGAGVYSDGTLHDVTGEIFNVSSEQWTLAPTDGGPPADGSIYILGEPISTIEERKVANHRRRRLEHLIARN